MIRRKLGRSQSEPRGSNDYFAAPLQEWLAQIGKSGESKDQQDQQDQHKYIAERSQSNSIFSNSFNFQKRNIIGCIEIKNNDQCECSSIMEALELELSKARGIQFELQEENDELSNDVQCLIEENIALHKESEDVHCKNQYQESIIQETCKERDELSLQLEESQEEMRILSDSNAYAEELERYKLLGRLMREEHLNQEIYYEEIVYDSENAKSHWMRQVECLMKDNDDYRETTQQMINEADRLRTLVDDLTTKREALEKHSSKRRLGVNTLLRLSSYRNSTRNISPECSSDQVPCTAIGIDDKHRENIEKYEVNMKTNTDVISPLKISSTTKSKDGVKESTPRLASTAESASLNGEELSPTLFCHNTKSKRDRRKDKICFKEDGNDDRLIECPLVLYSKGEEIGGNQTNSQQGCDLQQEHPIVVNSSSLEKMSKTDKSPSPVQYKFTKRNRKNDSIIDSSFCNKMNHNTEYFSRSHSDSFAGQYIQAETEGLSKEKEEPRLWRRMLGSLDMTQQTGYVSDVDKSEDVDGCQYDQHLQNDNGLSSDNGSNKDTVQAKWTNPPFLCGKIRASVIVSKTA